MNSAAWSPNATIVPPESERLWPGIQQRPVHYATTVVERLLLMVTVIILPLEDHVPTIAGFSILFLVFALLASYVFVRRTRALARTWLHPALVAAYTFVIIGFLVESAHPVPYYRPLISFTLMIAGAVFIASLCRDTPALRLSIYGYMIGSLWLSLLLFLTTYGALQRATAANYSEASNVRKEMSENISLEGDLNNMAFLAAQGGSVAFALTLTARSLVRRAIFIGIAGFCLVSAFLPMSRGGMIIAAGSCLSVLVAYRAQRMRAIALGGVIGVGILMFVPNVVFSRLQGVTEGKGRKEVYGAVVENLHQYVITGVGAGHYWDSWGYKHGFTGSSGNVLGAHNIYFQVTIYWGMAALLCLGALIWQVYRCFPKRCDADPLALCLPGITISLLLMSLFTHGFYDKWYALGVGLMVGSRLWIWPGGVIPTATRATKRLPVI